MGIRSAKEAIREARIKAGLTQEEMAEGVCSFQALSRIETGVSGVSPGTFQTLMEHAGVPCERYPVFSGRKEFDCFYALKHAHFYLDAWQTDSAWQELKKQKKKTGQATGSIIRNGCFSTADYNIAPAIITIIKIFIFC